MGSREEILGKIKNIRRVKEFDAKDEPDWKGEVLASISDPLDELFRKELAYVNGQCFLVKDEKEILGQLKAFFAQHEVRSIACSNDLYLQLIPDEMKVVNVKDADASITGCEYLVARTGSAIVSSSVTKSRQIQIYPPVHVVIGNESQLRPYLTDAIESLEEKYKGNLPSQISVITGPSRTADIEKTLVLGAHGPRELLVFIIKNK